MSIVRAVCRRCGRSNWSLAGRRICIKCRTTRMRHGKAGGGRNPPGSTAKRMAKRAKLAKKFG